MKCPKCNKDFDDKVNECDYCKYKFTENEKDNQIKTSKILLLKDKLLGHNRERNLMAGSIGFIFGLIFSIYIFSNETSAKFNYFLHYDLNLGKGLRDLILALLFIIPLVIFPILIIVINNLLNPSTESNNSGDLTKKLRESNNKQKMMQEQENYIKKQATQKNKQYMEENKIPLEAHIVKCIKSSLLGLNELSYLYIWHDKENIYFDRTTYYTDIKRLEISKSSISSFMRQGDVYNELKISGGKVEGGGSSLAGAVVGGIIAGGAGAVIGSRKKIQGEQIKSENIRIDTRETILEFLYEDKYEHLFFDSDTYNILIKLIPEKEIQFVNQRNAQALEEKEKESSINYDLVLEQIKKLSDLKEQGILTEEEFKEKKNVLLEKIS